MSWKDNLIPAFFRFAPFKVLDTTTIIGRRNVIHEFPFKDSAYVEDLGRKTDKFTITGYVVQNKDNNFNYFAERDDLIAALREPGQGYLEHPFLGIVLVSLVGDAELTESFREGGIARFRMTFMVTTEIGYYPTHNVLEGKQAIDNAAANGLTEIQESFEEQYEVDGVPDWSLDSITDAGLAFVQMAKRVVTDIIKGAVSSTRSNALGNISKTGTDLLL